jgi:hypothetical protein
VREEKKQRTPAKALTEATTGLVNRKRIGLLRAREKTTMMSLKLLFVVTAAGCLDWCLLFRITGSYVSLKTRRVATAITLDLRVLCCSGPVLLR